MDSVLFELPLVIIGESSSPQDESYCYFTCVNEVMSDWIIVESER